MYIYKHMLVAIDLSPSANIILQKAQKITQKCGAELSIIHVIEPLSIAYGSDVPLDLTTLQDEITQQATERIKKIVATLDINIKNIYILHGYPDQEIHQIIKKDNIDLLILGSHGRSGISLLAGSTSTDLMHGLTCDMLAIHVEE